MGGHTARHERNLDIINTAQPLEAIVAHHRNISYLPSSP